MADQKSTDAGISPIVKTFYDKRLIETLKPQQYLYQFAQKRPIPVNGGKTIEFTSYKKVNPLTSNSNELSSTQSYLSAFTITDTMITRHTYFQFSELLRDTGIDPRVMGAVDELADMGARSVELYLRNKIVAQIGTAARSSAAGHGINATLNSHQGDILGSSAQGTHNIWSSFPLLHNKTRLSSSGGGVTDVAGTAFSVNMVRHASSYLRSRDVKPYVDSDFVGIIHPLVADNLFADPKFQTWNKYQNAKKMFNGEIGRVFGVRFVSSTQAWRYNYSTASELATNSGAINATFIFGKNAFAATELTNNRHGAKGFELIIKRSGPSTVSDPANLKSTMAFKFNMASAVLNKSAGCLVISSDKVN